jgi:hypothetical protein
VATFASIGDFRYTEDPFRPNSMSIQAITCERKGRKQFSYFLAKAFARIDPLRRARKWISRPAF